MRVFYAVGSKKVLWEEEVSQSGGGVSKSGRVMHTEKRFKHLRLDKYYLINIV